MDSPRSTSSTESRPKHSAAIAEQSKEELQKTVQLLVRRLKQRDGQIKDFETRLASISETNNEDVVVLQREKEHLLHEKASLQESLLESATQLTEAQQHSQDVSNQLQELSLALQSTVTERNTLVSKLGDVNDQQEALTQQVASLKMALEGSLEEKEIAVNKLSEEKERTVKLEDALSSAQTQLRNQVQTGEKEAFNVDVEEVQKTWEQKLKNAELDFQEKESSLKAELTNAEQKHSTLESENAKIKNKFKEELKTSLKQKNQVDEKTQEMEIELNQHKTALVRVTGQLEETSQKQRITSQRLSDEQETCAQLKKELQEALSKVQNSELEMWKKSESLTSEKAELEHKSNLLLKEKETEINILQNQLEEQKKVQDSHEEEIEKLKQQGESEKDKLKKGLGELKRRLDKASTEIKETDSEKAVLIGAHSKEQETLKTEISSMEKKTEKLVVELKGYKAKAHLLVKTKDQEIENLQGQLKEQSDVELELKVLKEKFDDVTADRANLIEELTQANERFQIHLDNLVGNLQNQLNEKTTEVLDLEKACEEYYLSIQTWSKKYQELEKLLQEKEKTVVQEEEFSTPEKTEVPLSSCEECESVQRDLAQLEEEFSSYKKTMERMSEVQQLELSKLIQTNLDLRKGHHFVEKQDFSMSEQDVNSVDGGPGAVDSFHFEDLMNTRRLSKTEDDVSLSESQIVALANKQAEREDTFHTLRRKNETLTNEVEELEKELQLHKEQEHVLKNALRAADELRQANSGPPQNMDYQYLKNTVMKLITTGESEALLPVLARLLNFTDSEVDELTEEIQMTEKKKNEELSGSISILPNFSGWPWS